MVQDKTKVNRKSHTRFWLIWYRNLLSYYLLTYLLTYSCAFFILVAAVHNCRCFSISGVAGLANIRTRSYVHVRDVLVGDHAVRLPGHYARWVSTGRLPKYVRDALLEFHRAIGPNEEKSTAATKKIALLFSSIEQQYFRRKYRADNITDKIAWWTTCKTGMQNKKLRCCCDSRLYCVG